MPGQPQKLLVDTGPLIALFVARDKHHRRAVEFTKSCTATLFTTWPVVTEACFMLNARGKAALIAMIDSPALHVEDLKAADLGRLRELVEKYPRMDLADASLIVLAEYLGVVDIVTIDRTEFEAIYRTKAGHSFVNYF